MSHYIQPLIEQKKSLDGVEVETWKWKSSTSEGTGYLKIHLVHNFVFSLVAQLNIVNLFIIVYLNVYCWILHNVYGYFKLQVLFHSM